MAKTIGFEENSMLVSARRPSRLRSPVLRSPPRASNPRCGQSRRVGGPGPREGARDSRYHLALEVEEYFRHPGSLQYLLPNWSGRREGYRVRALYGDLRAGDICGGGGGPYSNNAALTLTTDLNRVRVT